MRKFEITRWEYEYPRLIKIVTIEELETLSEHGYKCLNLGSNKRIAEGCDNLDIQKIRGVNIIADLTKKLLIKNNTYDYIFATNILEHIPKDKINNTMKELYRILKPEGILFIACPHFTSSCYYINEHYGNFGCMWSIKGHINNWHGKTELTKKKEQYRLLKARLIFPKTYLRLYNYLIEWAVNINQQTIMFYEESPLRVFNAGGIHFYLQKC